MNNDDDDKKVKKLLDDAHDQGALSAKSLKTLDVVDVGQQIQAGLGVTIDDIGASEVVLVTMMPDDSQSIAHAGNTDAVRDGHNFVLQALGGSKQAGEVLAHTRYLNGFVLTPYTALEHAVLGGDSIPAPVRELVNPQPLGVPGGSSIVNATAWDAASGSFGVTAGPAMRMVVDLGDLDASTWVTVTGTSGHPGSVHYTDQLDAWAHGRTFPWPFSPEAVADAAARELTLRPAS